MTVPTYVNDYVTTLGGTGLTTSGTSLTPASTTGSPTADPTASPAKFFALRVDFDATTGRATANTEIVWVTDTRTVPWTVVRAAETVVGGRAAGSPVAHTAGVPVAVVASAGTLIPPARAVPVDTTGLTVVTHPDVQRALADLDNAFAAGSGALTRTAVKTANYTANANELVPVDTTAGNVTVTLPTAPSSQTRACVKHIIQGGTNTVTVACGGSDVFNKAGGSTALTLTLVNQALLVQYDGATSIWTVLADDLPLGALKLSVLADVNVAGIADGQLVVWNATLGKWVPANPTGTQKITHLENTGGTVTTATPPVAAPGTGAAVDVPVLTYTLTGDGSGRDVWVKLGGYGQQSGATGTGTAFLILVETTSGSTNRLVIPVPLPNSITSQSKNLSPLRGELNLGPIASGVTRSFKASVSCNIATGTANSTTFQLINNATEPSYLDFEYRA